MLTRKGSSNTHHPFKDYAKGALKPGRLLLYPWRLTMRRGTTPTHIFETDLDLRDASEIFLTYKQKDADPKCCKPNNVVLTKEKTDMEIEEDKVTVKLTQEETLMFSTKGMVSIQFRAKFPDGAAVASNIVNAKADTILREGVI